MTYISTYPMLTKKVVPCGPNLFLSILAVKMANPNIEAVKKVTGWILISMSHIEKYLPEFEE